VYTVFLGVAKAIYIRCIYGILCREITKYTVIYGAYTVGSRSLRGHTFKKLIKFSISVREGVWGIIFGFEGTSGGLYRESIFKFESPCDFCLCTATAVC
jgi:hypothetical protein